MSVQIKGPRKRGNIVAETLLLVMFPRRANEWEAEQMFCFLAAQTKKHFTGICCGRAQTGKHLRPQQCFRNNVSSFAGALRIQTSCSPGEISVVPRVIVKYQGVLSRDWSITEVKYDINSVV